MAYLFVVGKKNKPEQSGLCSDVARQEGLEPPTFWFVAKHSIQLSYWRIVCLRLKLVYHIRAG